MILNFIVYEDAPPEIISLESSIPEDLKDAIDLEYRNFEDDLGIEQAEFVFQKIDENNEMEEWVIPIDLEHQEDNKLIEGKMSVDLSKFNLEKEDELSFVMRVEDSHAKMLSKIKRLASNKKVLTLKRIVKIQPSDQEESPSQKQKDESEKGQISESSTQKIQTEKQKDREKLQNKLALDKSLDQILERLTEAPKVLLLEKKDLDDTKVNQEIDDAALKH